MTERGRAKPSPKTDTKGGLQNLIQYPAVYVETSRNASMLQGEDSSPVSGKHEVVGNLQNYEMVPMATEMDKQKDRDRSPSGRDESDGWRKHQHPGINVSTLGPSRGDRYAGVSQEDLMKGHSTLSPAAGTRGSGLHNRASAVSMASQYSNNQGNYTKKGKHSNSYLKRNLDRSGLGNHDEYAYLDSKEWRKKGKMIPLK